MTSTTETKPQRRRTQAERRAATRGALLDATVECLAEYGYADATIARIVERAGVSRGAQVHHYPTKAELVADAVTHLARRRATELYEEVAREGGSGRRRVGVMLDVLWRQHTSPLFAAAMELYVAARTDAELRAKLVEVEREVTRSIFARANDLFPEQARTRELKEAVEVALSTMRGLAMMGFVDPASDLERRWATAKRRLVAIFPGEPARDSPGRLHRA